MRECRVPLLGRPWGLVGNVPPAGERSDRAVGRWVCPERSPSDPSHPFIRGTTVSPRREGVSL